MNQIIPAVMKQQGIAQQREEQMRQEQKAAQEKQRQEKLAETQWKRGKQFDMAMKTGDFILKAKDLPYNVLKPAVDMFVKAGKTVGYDFDARALLDETQRATAVKTGIQNKLGELFEKAQSGDPRSVQEFMVANADYAKVNGGKLHEVFGPAMQELTKNAMSPSGGMTGDMGQLEQAKRMLQRQGGMGGGQPNINQPNPLNPGQMMASSTAGETTNMGPMQLLQKLQEMKQTPKQLTPQQEAFQRLTPDEQKKYFMEGKQGAIGERQKDVAQFKHGLTKELQTIKTRDIKDISSFKNNLKVVADKDLTDLRHRYSKELVKLKGEEQLNVSTQLKALDEENWTRKQAVLEDYRKSREDRAFEIYKRQAGVDQSKQESLIKFKDAMEKSPVARLIDERDKIASKNPNDPNLILFDNMIRSKTLPNYSKPQLTLMALKGDPEAKAVLEKLDADEVMKAGTIAERQTQAKLGMIDVPGVADAIIDGRETIENVKNTFGVAVQEAVRKEVLAREPKFNFVEPRANLKAKTASLQQIEKQFQAMGSFVKNMNKQIDRVGELMKEISRTDIRAINQPLRYLKRTALGSAIESKLIMYATEISNDAARLSAGSPQSIAELTEYAQKVWSAVHDPNLSVAEIKDIMNETRHLGAVRIESVGEQRTELMGSFKNIRNTGASNATGQSKKMTPDIAAGYLKRTNGDRTKAEELAKKEGYTW